MEYDVEKMSEEFTKFHLNREGHAPWPFRPVIHKFNGPDKGGPHDHPWGFTSHVLHGSYVEKVYTVTPDGTWSSTTFHRKAGTAHQVAATCIHEIIELPDGECFTLVLAGPWERETQFWRFEDYGAFYRNWRDGSPWKELAS